MIRLFRATCLLAIVLGFSGMLRAAEEITPTVIASESAEMVSTETETTFTFQTNVVVTGSNIKITCDELVVVAYRTGDPKDSAKLAMAKADAAYEVAKEKCDDRSGNDKDVCVKEAKANHTKATADAKANKKVAEVRKDAAEDKRDASYNLAKEKCDALSGDSKSQCLATAKARHGKS